MTYKDKCSIDSQVGIYKKAAVFEETPDNLEEQSSYFNTGQDRFNLSIMKRIVLLNVFFVICFLNLSS